VWGDREKNSEQPSALVLNSEHISGKPPIRCEHDYSSSCVVSSIQFALKETNYMTLLKTVLALALALATFAGYASPSSIQAADPIPHCFPCK
jgi:hypothetical protein